MEINEINIGSIPNDGTGDPVRDSFDKVNGNFIILLNAIQELQGGGDFPTQPGESMGGVEVYDPTKTYKPGDNVYVFHNSKVYQFISNEDQTDVEPGTAPTIWQETPWSKFFHVQNSDYRVADHVAEGLNIAAGTWNVHTESLYKKNVLILQDTMGEDTKEITLDTIPIEAISLHVMRHPFLVYVAQGDDNKYVFKEGDSLKTGFGDVELEAGDWALIKWVSHPFIPDPEGNPSAVYAGRFILMGSSYREPVEGLTPEFQMDGSLFQYKIAGEVEWTTIFDMDNFIPANMQDAVDHAQTPHGVTPEGGFRGGTDTKTTTGVAAGHNAKCELAGEPINAIQLGSGVNDAPNTLKAYGYRLMNADGTIPEGRIPQASQTRGIQKISSPSHLVQANNRVFITLANANNVVYVLPAASATKNLPFVFRLGAQQFGYSMTVERSGDDKIIVNGEEWNGITSDDLGFWFEVVSDGENYYVTSDSGIIPANNI